MLHVREQVTVYIQRKRRTRVSELLSNDFGGDACGKRQSRGSMAGVVQADVRQPRLAQDRLEPLCQLIGANRATRRGGEGQVGCIGLVTLQELPFGM